MTKGLLKVNNLSTCFKSPKGMIRIADDVSFFLNKGETACIIGESGSGKTQSILSILGLTEFFPGVIGGEVFFEDQNIFSGLSEYVSKQNGSIRKDHSGWKKRLRRNLNGIRGKQISLILQDPTAAFSPYLTIGETLTQVIRKHNGIASFNEAKDLALSWLEKVQLNEPEKVFGSYVFQLSGGMAQRAMIALALCTKPKLLIADEPTTALDVTIQKSILDLLQSLKIEKQLSMVIVTHDFGIAANYADRIFVMYAGSIVEHGPKDEILFGNKNHPYTAGLLKAARASNNAYIKGAAPDLSQIPTGCPFHPRCNSISLTIDKGKNCTTKIPEPAFINKHHCIACWLTSQESNETN